MQLIESYRKTHTTILSHTPHYEIDSVQTIDKEPLSNSEISEFNFQINDTSKVFVF